MENIGLYDIQIGISIVLFILSFPIAYLLALILGDYRWYFIFLAIFWFSALCIFVYDIFSYEKDEKTSQKRKEEGFYYFGGEKRERTIGITIIAIYLFLLGIGVFYNMINDYYLRIIYCTFASQICFFVVCINLGISCFIEAYGLLKLEGWARIIVLLSAALSIIHSILNVAGFELYHWGVLEVLVVLDIAIILYLLRPEIKTKFQNEYSAYNVLVIFYLAFMNWMLSLSFLPFFASPNWGRPALIALPLSIITGVIVSYYLYIRPPAPLLTKEPNGIDTPARTSKLGDNATSVSNIEEIGKYAECPYCGSNIRETFYELGGIVRCDKCGAFHHRECFEYYGKKCGSPSCKLREA